MGLKEGAEIVSIAILVLGGFAGVVRSWALMKDHARRATAVAKEGVERTESAVKELRDEIVPTLASVKGASESTMQLAQEALRQAQAAHSRLDPVVRLVERLDERTSILKQTGRFRISRDKDPGEDTQG